MRVLICGGRDFTDHKLLEGTLDKYAITAIINGGARGADALSTLYARVKSIPLEIHYARWDLHGKAAGPIRNQRMLDEGRPDLVLAFPGGIGTNDMVQRAIKAGVKVIQIDAAQHPSDGAS